MQQVYLRRLYRYLYHLQLHYILGDQSIGFVLIQQFVISFGFLLPVSAPQNMLAYGTGTFTVKDFLKTGVPLTIIAYILVIIFSLTYWKWLGLV